MSAVFKTSIFGGFRKKDVLTYLDTLAAERAEAPEREATVAGQVTLEYEERIATLSDELSAALADRDAALRMADEANTALEQMQIAEQEARCRMEEEIETLKAENTALALSLEQLQKEQKTPECVKETAENNARTENILQEFSMQLDRVADELVKVVKSLPAENEVETPAQSARNSSVREILARVQQMKRKI